MSVGRRLALLVLASALGSAMLGVAVTMEAVRRSVLTIVEDRVRGSWTPEAALACEQAPASTALTVGPAALLYAYASDGVPHHPSAPALDASLSEGLARGALRSRAAEGSRPGLVVLRTGGPRCAYVQVEFRGRSFAAPMRRNLLVGVAVTAVGAAGLSLLLVVWPLARRSRALVGFAETLGLDTLPSPPRGDDELDAIAHALALARDRMRSDRDLLERRSDTIERHLADVAHDLRTPLTSLQLALERASVDGPDRDALLASALRDCAYVASLVENLRLASTLEAGWPHAPVPLDLREPVHKVVERAAVLTKRRGIELDHALPDEPVLVLVDPVAAERMIANLVDNAVHHVDPGCHVAVVLALEHGRFELSIVDDGAGFDPTAERVAARGRGRGLGLEIARTLARAADLELTIAPRPEGGTSAIFRGRTSSSEPAVR